MTTNKQTKIVVTVSTRLVMKGDSNVPRCWILHVLTSFGMKEEVFIDTKWPLVWPIQITKSFIYRLGI